MGTTRRLTGVQVYNSRTPRLLRKVMALAFILPCALSTHATDFYVDPDFGGSVQNGQPANPWSQLGSGTSAAWAAINSALASGNVTVFFSARQAGSDSNQPWAGELYLYRTNNSSNRLTLDGMSKYNSNDSSPAWSNYSGASRFQITGNYPISTYDVAAPQSYVTIRGFRVISVGGQLLQYGKGGSHVIIEQNEFSAASTAVIGAGVAFGDVPGTVDLIIRNNVIHDTFGEAIYLGGHSYTVGSPTNLDGILVEGNHIYNVGKWGGEGDCIDLKAGLANAVIRNNVCHDNQGGNADGIPALSPLTAEGNVIYNVAGNGVTFGSGVAPNVIRKNIFFNTGKQGVYAADMATLPVNTTIVSNTIYNCLGGIGIGADSASSVFTVKNNIVMKCGGGMGGWVPASGMATYTIKYNDVYANSTDYGWPFNRPDFFPTLAADNLSVDPLFVNAASPAGLDGKFGTSDDGFMLQSASPVATAGEGGTYIGALPPVGGPPPNQPPAIISIPWANPNPVTLPGSTTVSVVASDPDNGPAALTYTWSMLGGPGTVSFSPNGTTASANSTATFSASGSYVLRVTVYDGLASVTSDVSVSVNASSDSIPPTVAITLPGNGAQLVRRSTVNVTADASDNVGVSRVEFYVNGALTATDANAPYGFAWKVPGKPGASYQLQAKAYDAAGNVGFSNAITVTAK